MKVVFLALLAQAAAKDTPAKVGCVAACKPPSPVDSHCVTDCQQDMYQCIDETGPKENEKNTKACQDKVLKMYTDTKGLPEKKKEEKKEEEKKKAFLQDDFDMLNKIEESGDFVRPHAEEKVEERKKAFLQQDLAMLNKIVESGSFDIK